MELPVHPLLAKMKPEEASKLTSLRGYVGPSATEGRVRLYASLADLSDSVEIAKADIVYFDKTPESVLPFGGTIVWLKKDAEVTNNRVESVAGVKTDREIFEVNRGRLRFLVRRGIASDVCQSRCGVCQSRCSVCHSRCAARFGEASSFAEQQIKAR